MKLDQRLTACAEFIDENSFVADIGTDHGYLPVYLVENGISTGAIACDIGQMPLNSAKRTIEKYNLGDKISTCLSDGLKSVPRGDITHIVIAGMGGETIQGILSACDWAKECILILQPMTKSEDLRKWLFENGYEIEKEKAIIDGKYNYTVLKCVFSGNFKKPTPLEITVGGLDLKDESTRAYLEKKADILEKTGSSKLKSSEHTQDGAEDLTLAKEIRGVLGDN